VSIAELNSAAWIQSEDTLEYCPSWADDDEPEAVHGQDDAPPSPWSVTSQPDGRATAAPGRDDLATGCTRGS
jgi:hypothetical protein